MGQKERNPLLTNATDNIVEVFIEALEGLMYSIVLVRPRVFTPIKIKTSSELPKPPDILK